MSSGWKGMALGALGLFALERAVTGGKDSAGRVGGLFEIPGRVAKRFLDPTIPAFGAIPAPPQGTTTADTSNASGAPAPIQDATYSPVRPFSPPIGAPITFDSSKGALA